jgi:hypothetical protein
VATAKTENNKNIISTATPPPTAEKRKMRFTTRYEMSTIFYAFDYSPFFFWIAADASENFHYNGY